MEVTNDNKLLLHEVNIITFFGEKINNCSQNNIIF